MTDRVCCTFKDWLRKFQNTSSEMELTKIHVPKPLLIIRFEGTI